MFHDVKHDTTLFKIEFTVSRAIWNWCFHYKDTWTARSGMVPIKRKLFKGLETLYTQFAECTLILMSVRSINRNPFLTIEYYRPNFVVIMKCNFGAIFFNVFLRVMIYFGFIRKLVQAQYTNNWLMIDCFCFFHYNVISDLFIFIICTCFINHVLAFVKLHVFNHTRDSQGRQ